jgi:hypothetical protein
MATYTATTSPMIITSAATVTFINNQTRPCNAKRIEWVAPTTIGNTLSIQDLSGNTIFQETAGATLTSIVLWPGPGKFMLPGKQASFASTGNPGGSFVVATIASGSLLIWY